MPQTTIAADLDQPLDIHLDFTPQITLDTVPLTNNLAQCRYFCISEITDTRVGMYAGLGKNLRAARIPDSVNIRQTNLDPLVTR
jgi:hypothetical protein